MSTGQSFRYHVSMDTWNSWNSDINESQFCVVSESWVFHLTLNVSDVHLRI